MTALARVCDWFERLTPATLDELDRHYAADVRFKDPFHDVVGVDAVRAIFAHTFDKLPDARFRVTGRFVGTQHAAMILWEMDCALGGSRDPVAIRGSTHLLFDEDDRVTLHRDYWDAAEELYGRVPGLRWLMHTLARRVAAPTPSAG